MKQAFAVTGLIAALALLAGCSSAAAPATESSTGAGDPAAGKQIFDTGGASGIPCATCHTLDGSTLVGPSLQGIAERAGTRERGLSAEDYIRQSIKTPSAFLVPGYGDLMNKTYAVTLSEQDIDNLITFLMTQ